MVPRWWCVRFLGALMGSYTALPLYSHGLPWCFNGVISWWCTRFHSASMVLSCDCHLGLPLCFQGVSSHGAFIVVYALPWCFHGAFVMFYARPWCSMVLPWWCMRLRGASRGLHGAVMAVYALSWCMRFYGKSMVLSSGFGGSFGVLPCMVLPWCFCQGECASMRLLWCFNGAFMVHPWGCHGGVCTSMVLPWCLQSVCASIVLSWIPVVLPWCFPWRFHGERASMVFPWYWCCMPPSCFHDAVMVMYALSLGFYGVFMVYAWWFYGAFMRLH